MNTRIVQMLSASERIVAQLEAFGNIPKNDMSVVTAFNNLGATLQVLSEALLIEMRKSLEEQK